MVMQSIWQWLRGKNFKQKSEVGGGGGFKEPPRYQFKS